MYWKKEKEPPTEVKFLPDMSRAILRQDGAPAHHDRKTQDWCPESFPGFWEKGTWSGKSSGPVPDRKSLGDRQRRAQQAVAGQLGELGACPIPERTNAMAECKHGSLEGVGGLKTSEAYHSKADALVIS